MNDNYGVKSQMWPEHGLENIGQCPICGFDGRKMMHAGLIDYFYKCAPGEWSLYECRNCESAYLDPRPTAETIGLAYRDYFTHEITPPVKSRHTSSLRRYIRRIANGYLNSAFKCKRSDASRIGAVIIPFLKPLELYLQAEARHLPKLPNNGGTLLDIGCGNGDFIKLADEAGWETFGIDPDPKAIEATKCLGLDAQVGSIESINNQQKVYDIITSSHVIEHVHDPIGLLTACHHLLKPGGMLWLETPNIKSYGHRFYGRFWRGLEIPRHLIIFSPSGLLKMLDDVGFINVKQKHRALSTFFSFPESERVLNEARRPGKLSGLPGKVSLLLRHLYAEIVEAITPNKREFLTIIAFKAK